MSEPKYYLRASESGPLLRGTAGYVLAFQADGTLEAVPVPSAPVSSVFGRVGAILPAVGDYTASQVANDSGVSGATVADALDTVAADAATAQGTANAAGVVATAAAAAAAAAQSDATAAGTAAATAQGTATAAAAAAAAAQSDATAAGTAAAAAQTTANTAVAAAAAADAKATAAEQPFLASYYVNPSFAGVQTGSASNPFTTAAACFAAVAALALVGCVIKLPPNVTLTENVVFPATGGIYEITSDTGFTGSSTGPRITGSITCNCTSGVLTVRLSNIIVNGNTAGLASTGTLIVLTETSVRQVGTITLTQTGTGNCLGVFRGIGPAYAGKTGGSNTGLVSVAGQIVAENWVFEGGCTEALATIVTPYPGSTWRSCQLGSTNGTAVTMNLNGVSNAFFYDCVCSGPVTLASTTSGYTVFMDGATLAAFNNAISGLILTGTAMVLKTLNANASAQSTVTGNVGSTAYGSRSAAGLYAVDVSLTLGAAGTLGNLQHNVIYTDSTGTLITAAVGGTLNIAGAVGSKVSGTLVFEHNGAAAAIAFSFTGVTTAGAMSVSHISAVRRLN
jgi:hypothetical protein